MQPVKSQSLVKKQNKKQKQPKKQNPNNKKKLKNEVFPNFRSQRGETPLVKKKSQQKTGERLFKLYAELRRRTAQLVWL